MTVSQLIHDLTKILKDHGDIPVAIQSLKFAFPDRINFCNVMSVGEAKTKNQIGVPPDDPMDIDLSPEWTTMTRRSQRRSQRRENPEEALAPEINLTPEAPRKPRKPTYEICPPHADCFEVVILRG